MGQEELISVKSIPLNSIINTDGLYKKNKLVQLGTQYITTPIFIKNQEWIVHIVVKNFFIEMYCHYSCIPIDMNYLTRQYVRMTI